MKESQYRRIREKVLEYDRSVQPFLLFSILSLSRFTKVSSWPIEAMRRRRLVGGRMWRYQISSEINLREGFISGSCMIYKDVQVGWKETTYDNNVRISIGIEPRYRMSAKTGELIMRRF